MNEFQSLVAELKQMAAREAVPADAVVPSKKTHTRHDEFAEYLVRRDALLGPECYEQQVAGASPELISALERARIKLRDEVTKTQLVEYIKARRFAEHIDQQNLENPGANYAYPARVTANLARFSHLWPEGQE